MLKIKESYITVVDDRQVVKTIYENGQVIISECFPTSETPQENQD